MSDNKQFDRESAERYISQDTPGMTILSALGSIVGLIIFVVMMLWVAGPFGAGFWIGVASATTAWLVFFGVRIAYLRTRNRDQHTPTTPDQRGTDVVE